MTISTKKGDFGETQLWSGRTVKKNDSFLDLIGDLDELNSALGIIRSMEDKKDIRSLLKNIQMINFTFCAEIACPNDKKSKLKQRIGEDELGLLDDWVIKLEKNKQIDKGWQIPGDTKLDGFYNMGRSIARRTERKLVGLNEEKNFNNPYLLSYLNRLSDLLWLLGSITK